SIASTRKPFRSCSAAAPFECRAKRPARYISASTRPSTALACRARSRTFAAGLDLLPAGQEVNARLGLEPGTHVEHPGITAGVRRFAATPGFTQKAELAVREVFPTRDYLRAHVPLARRGRLGVVLARIRRPFSLLFRLFPALIAVARSRGRPPA